MRNLRSLGLGLSACAAVAVFAGCSGVGQQSPAVPNQTRSQQSVARQGEPADLSAISSRAVIRPLGADLLVGAGQDGVTAPSAALYVGQFEANFVNQYAVPDKSNKPPTCAAALPNITVNGIAVNAQHILYVPNGDPNTEIFRISRFGPKCGQAGPPLNDPSGEPTDVAFNNRNGTVYVADYHTGAPSPPNSFVLVYPKGQTSYTRVLSNIAVGAGFSVAVDSHGNVFQGDRDSTNIVEYPNGQQTGSKVRGLSGSSAPLGLQFDRKDNLVVIDENLGILVYAPPYTGAPYAMEPTRGLCAYGALDAANRNLYVADTTYASADVFAYPSLKYEYSITNGLSTSNFVSGIAVDPPSQVQ